MAFFIPGIRALWSGKREKDPPTETPPAEGKRTGEAPERTMRTYAREAAALLLIATGLYVALALASYSADPLRPDVSGRNWVGPVGEVLARLVVELVGVVGWLIPIELIAVARPLLFDKRMTMSLGRLAGDVLVAVVSASLAHIAFPSMAAFGNMPIAGIVGDFCGEICRGLFSTIGSFLIGLTAISLILIERATFSFIAVTQRARSLGAALRDRTGRGVSKVAVAWEQARATERERQEAARLADEPRIASPEEADAIIAAFADDGSGIPNLPSPAPPVVMSRTPPPVSAKDADEALLAGMTEGDPFPACGGGTGGGGKLRVDRSMVTPPPPTVALAPTPEPVGVAPPETDKASRPTLARLGGRPKKNDGPTIVDTSAAAKTKKAARGKAARGAFVLPGTELLDPLIAPEGGHSPEQLKATARQLEKTLADYGVQGSVQEIHPGPTVTMFEISPAPGTKVSKVASLADDLALGLSRKVRIVAPIPGKARIGFEVPNNRRIPVNLRELIESADFMELKKPLPCILGRDIIGRPCFADLSSMPHVIVAGATGAGKSVGLNVMLVSLLYRRTPEEMRLLMIDPKVVELAPFDRIPHLLFPVVTDMKQAANALKWAVDEMERRYQLFADAGTRNIGTYNRYVRRVRDGEIPPPPPPARVGAIGPDGEVVHVASAQDGSDAALPQRLPFIVVVVEEFADLMMTQGKEVEVSIARLAQKARAAGLHVILATQRPSVDVITGMIKANFPTRIAFRVAQKVDSRTILDEQGAEHLLGQGDMLVKLNGQSDVRRVQCPFVSEDEVQRITDHLRRQGEPVYDESIVRARDDGDVDEDHGSGESDPLYDQAVSVVAETRKCSTSWIQRKLGIGYNRAAKIVETMEKNGVIGPPNGSKPRDIYISPQ